MQAVIVRHEKNAKNVAKLQAHCEQLDGTELRVIDQTGKFLGLGYPEICNAGFLSVLKAMDDPFFFLEDDAIPLKPGWLSELEEAFHKSQRNVLVSIDQQTPWDLCSGIGVYDPIILDDMPDGIAGVGWDEWIMRYRPEWLAKTHLIQHSYGRYNTDGIAAGWEFPRDRWLIRDTTLVFHKDASQSLLT